VALKKWIKAIMDVAMILIVLTDDQPVAALRRLFSRAGFILIPISMLFYKYYPDLGHSYDSWTGAQSTNGAALDKNMLGVISFVLLLGIVWSILPLLWPDEKVPDRGRHLLARGTILVLGLFVLIASDSVTSLVCFVIGTGLMLTTRLKFLRRKPAAIHVLVLSLAVCTSVVMLLGGGASTAQALGRNPTLTGRTEIWAAVLPMAPNPVVGAGFESFWLSSHVKERLAILFPGLPLNEAHDGYIEVYLNLGWVGLGLIGLILIDGYRRSVKAFRREPVLGSLCLAFILTEMVYNITEAGFRMLDPIWFFFLLAVMGASSIAAGVSVGSSPPPGASRDQVPALPARKALMMGANQTNCRGKLLRGRTT
jgi:exopolysaccharide production protein ExoQ